MPRLAGVNHFALSVTDLDRSTRFYTEVLGLLAVLNLGTGRVLMDTRSGFTVGLIQHGSTEPFSESRTGLDHIGLDAADRAELEAWVERFDALGVSYTPIQDMDLGYHLNFRDPDGIALEFQAPNEVWAGALEMLRSREMTDAEVLAAAEQFVGKDLIARP